MGLYICNVHLGAGLVRGGASSVWPSDLNRHGSYNTCGNTDRGHHHTLATSGLQTQTCPGQKLRPGCYHGPGGSKAALRHQHALWWLSRPQASTQPFLIIGARDINSEPCCCWVTDSDMALGSSLCLDDTMFQCGSNKVLRYQHATGCNLDM